ncbi:MAG: helix-turn-helix domain-containing protein [Planctomycetes bacterium]|nr:helix-turn-helix domain-containing protein [Planctomycetota bacterium]
MLKPDDVKMVEELLASGNCSQRAIALRTGVSRATIAAIASGKRSPRTAMEEETQAATQRCQGCGILVKMPCRVCAVRRYQTQVLAVRRWKAHLAARQNSPRRPAA